MTSRRRKKTTESVRYLSPNSLLPPEQLDRLRECIEGANRLLRTLGNPRDAENTTQLRQYFQTLSGLLVKVEVDRGTAEQSHIEHPYGPMEVVGVLATAGKDFLLLESVGDKFLVPFVRICSVQHHISKLETHDPDLRRIDPCLREGLVLRFGETVAGNPELLNRFLGIPLYLQLLAYVGCDVTLHTEGTPAYLRGVLVDAKEDAVRIEDLRTKECIDVHIGKSCVIAVHSERKRMNLEAPDDPEGPDDPEDPDEPEDPNETQ